MGRKIYKPNPLEDTVVDLIHLLPKFECVLCNYDKICYPFRLNKVDAQQHGINEDEYRTPNTHNYRFEDLVTVCMLCINNKIAVNCDYDPGDYVCMRCFDPNDENHKYALTGPNGWPHFVCCSCVYDLLIAVGPSN
uniref:Uncharacterized protein n=1 Tax=viral metagenome TaxID=1070528 RepID=A0A6C0CKL9_9ZZZZ